jgi:hypothetical protein
MILVMYKNGRCAKVPAPLLGRLIQQGEISHFRRDSGWVQVCLGPEKRGGWRTHLD